MAERILHVREEPSFPNMLEIVRALNDCAVTSASNAGVHPDKLPIIGNWALQNNAFQICSVNLAPEKAIDAFCYSVGHTTSVFSGSVTTADIVITVGTLKPGVADTIIVADTCNITIQGAASVVTATVTIDTELMLNSDINKFEECFQMYNLAVSTVVAEQITTSKSQQILRQLMANLSLSYDNVGRMFRVSGETVRRWENGTNAIPNERNSEITLAREPLNKLLQMFLPSKLPQVIRRTAQLFNGERALDWILQGRISEVANRYELSLRYQA